MFMTSLLVSGSYTRELAGWVQSPESAIQDEIFAGDPSRESRAQDVRWLGCCRVEK